TELLGRARQFVGRYRVTVDPPGATLVVDGRAAALESDGTLLLDAGQHELVARAPEHRDATVPVDVRGGEDTTLDVNLPSLVVQPRDTGSDALAMPHTPPSEAASHGGTDVMPIVWLSAAGALAVTSVILGATWWASRGAQIQTCLDA